MVGINFFNCLKKKQLMNVDSEYERALIMIGFKLQELRRKKGFATSQSFADAYDLPRDQYDKMENGNSNLNLKSLVRVLKIHRLSLEDFFCLLLDRAAA
jgi:hypothetical protein